MIHREDGVLNIDGLSIEYRKFSGTKAGPMIVLLHEGLGSVSAWKDFPELLCKATGLSVFLYSRAGYGNSSPIKLPRSVDFHSDEAVRILPKILDAAEIERCILLGHSDGASIATIYAGAKNLDNQAERLILLAPHIFAEEKCVTAVEQAITAYENGKLRKALRKFHGKNTECAFRGWSDVWTDPEFSCWNIEEYLPFIKIPVLAIRGEDDPYNTIIHLDGITERVSGEVECFNLSNCAHAPHQEQEARVLRLIEKFLRACRN